jgi:hypothetical protein
VHDARQSAEGPSLFGIEQGDCSIHLNPFNDNRVRLCGAAAHLARTANTSVCKNSGYERADADTPPRTLASYLDPQTCYLPGVILHTRIP